jgi:hypothetical protein
MGLLVERTKRMPFFQRLSYRDIGFANLVFVPQMPVCFPPMLRIRFIAAFAFSPTSRASFLIHPRGQT